MSLLIVYLSHYVDISQQTALHISEKKQHLCLCVNQPCLDPWSFTISVVLMLYSPKSR